MKRKLRDIVENIEVIIIPPQILMFNQPLHLLLDHLLRWQEHVLENVNKLSLQLGVGNLLPHFQNFNDGLLQKVTR